MKPRALFVTPVSPHAQSSGAEQRSHLMHEALREVFTLDVLRLSEAAATRIAAAERSESAGVDVGSDVAINVAVELKPNASALQRFRPQAAATRAIEQALGRPLAGYELIVGRYLWPVCQLDIPAHVPVLVDLDDWHYRYSPAAPHSLAAWRERTLKFLAHSLARRQLQRFAGAFAVSASDRDELGRHVPAALLPNVPIGVPASVAPVPAAPELLFVGSLWYRPNAEGIDWFLRAVWPQVRAALPAARLHLVGAAAPAARARWQQQPGVTAPGFVAQIADAYRECAAVLVPIHSGGGTNIKVLEAMAHGRPCVVTGFIERAFAPAFQAGRHFLVADSAEQFALALLAALRQPAAMQRMADEARARVAECCSAANFKNTVIDFATATMATATAATAKIGKTGTRR